MLEFSPSENKGRPYSNFNLFIISSLNFNTLLEKAVSELKFGLVNTLIVYFKNDTLPFKLTEVGLIFYSCNSDVDNKKLLKI